MNASALPLPLADFMQKARAELRHGSQASWASLGDACEVAPAQLTAMLAEQFGWRAIEPHELELLKPVFNLLPLARCLERQAVFLRDGQEQLIALVSNPFDMDLVTWLETRAGQPLQFALAQPADIQVFLEKQEFGAKTMDTLVQQPEHRNEAANSSTVLSFSSVSDAISPAVKLVNSTLYDALKAGASDIHMESTSVGMTVKYRIDGVLNSITTFSGVDLTEQAISRLKVLAELDIAERRIPQDGSFRVMSGNRDIDLRLSIMPSIHGEDAVIRVLDKRAMIEAYGSLSLHALGFDEDSLLKLRRLAQAAHGMLLVTGPTGSGKTTTLYAAISETNNGRDKIITIEDPVEYQLPGVLQIPVNHKKGLTFARGLRSILRHDPDKIMVGEIRDAETAEIAIQSALTGHLVLTTVHANNVFDVFGRFTHMNIDPYAFVSALNGVWAQRLIRLNCPRCSRPEQPTEELLVLAGIERSQIGGNCSAGAGCGDCRGTGYRGRRAIGELLVLNDEIRELIIAKAPIRKIKEAAHAYGTRSIRDVGLEMVARGETTLEEIHRVTLAE